MALPDPRSPPLVGRAHELEAVRAVVRAAPEDGGGLLVTGDPGVGKSALLAVAATEAEAAGYRVLRAAGVEYETEVAFAGLHQLLDPLDDVVQALPTHQREVLGAALGRGAAVVPERLAVFDASLAAVRAAASGAPLLVVVDDMHWLDRASASVVGFVGRRLHGARVALLGAARPGGGFFVRAGWPELVLGPLAPDDALDLLARRFEHLPPRARREVAREAQGNPLALLEFGAAAGGPRAAVAPAEDSGREVRRLYHARIGALPAGTRSMMLLAALEGRGSLVVLGAAGGGLRVLAPAELDGLVAIDERAGTLRFRHPMIASVLVDRSTLEERRTVHRLLADLLAEDPERRAHHLARAAVEPSEPIAAVVEQGARLTLRRGDVVGGVSGLVRAAELSPDPADRGRRLASAAFVGAFQGGGLDEATSLLRDARRDDPSVEGTLTAAVATAYLLLNSDGDVELSHRLLAAAVDAALDEPEQDDEGLSLALYTLVVVCHYAGRVDLWRELERLLGRLAPGAAADAVLLADVHGDVASASVAGLRGLDRAVERLEHSRDTGDVVRTAIAAFYLDRLSDCRPALDRLVRDESDGGAAGSALMALSMSAFDDYQSGRWADARRQASRTADRCAQLGFRLYEWSARYALALVDANRGEREACAAVCADMLEWATPRGLGRLRACAHHALAESALASADFETAFDHAARVSPPGRLEPYDPQALWCALDLVDAAVHTGRVDDARAHADAVRAADLARLSPRFALEVAAIEAMVAPDGEAPSLFEKALARPGVDAWPFLVARVKLALGERLRRQRRIREARTQLQAARDGFDALGAAPWSQRAVTELRACGGLRLADRGGGVASLTAQELEVVRLAAGGLTNREIASRLFLSPRTVSTHLYRAFPKLGVTTRAALRDALDGA